MITNFKTLSFKVSLKAKKLIKLLLMSFHGGFHLWVHSRITGTLVFLIHTCRESVDSKFQCSLCQVRFCNRKKYSAYNNENLQQEGSCIISLQQCLKYKSLPSPPHSHTLISTGLCKRPFDSSCCSRGEQLKEIVVQEPRNTVFPSFDINQLYDFR